jgi:uncharacterized protein YqgC (DUF456 family)
LSVLTYTYLYSILIFSSIFPFLPNIHSILVGTYIYLFIFSQSFQTSYLSKHKTNTSYLSLG